MVGGFRLPCVIFGGMFPAKLTNLRKLVCEPVKYWPDAKASFTRDKNKACGLHHKTTGILATFLENMSGKTQPINVVIDINLKKKIPENRKKLINIVDAIILCGPLGLPLRSHTEDSKFDQRLGIF